MRKLITEGVKVQMCVTSPPYWGLRNYGHPGQFGLEKTPEEYTANMVEVFGLVRELLTDDGTFWLNIGDSYAGSWGDYVAPLNTKHKGQSETRWNRPGYEKGNHHSKPPTANLNGLKKKDLVGIPWMVAFALRGDGWYLRQDIIWHKPNPMPESVTDRCTKSHEYIFLMSKSSRYYFDQDAIKEPIKDSSAARLMQDIENQTGSERVQGKTNGPMKAVAAIDSWHGSSFDRGKTGEMKHTRGGMQKAVKFGGNKQCPDTRLQSGKEWNPKMAGGGTSYRNGHSGYFDKAGNPLCGLKANKKSVWTVTTKGYKGAHFATFPPDLIKPCVLAGSRPGDIVLDPFFGSGTTGQVAESLGRQWIGCEINEQYRPLWEERTRQAGLCI